VGFLIQSRARRLIEQAALELLLVAQVQAVVGMAEVFEMLICDRLRLNVIGSGVLTAPHHIYWS